MVSVFVTVYLLLIRLQNIRRFGLPKGTPGNFHAYLPKKVISVKNYLFGKEFPEMTHKEHPINPSLQLNAVRKQRSASSGQKNLQI